MGGFVLNKAVRPLTAVLTRCQMAAVWMLRSPAGGHTHADTVCKQGLNTGNCICPSKQRVLSSSGATVKTEQ